ncbi:MAG: CHASE2 domain-containing protein [Acidobacteriota bacterium]|nr:CHASE2 domain-containing protein [Acidobacteriota bacterium]
MTTLFFAALYFLKPTLLQPLDSMNYDLLLRHFPNNHASPRVVIVDLDENSLNRFGQWPWPRNQVAELFDRITALKPAVIGLDMFFAEPDRTSPARLLKALREAGQLDPALDLRIGEWSDNDQVLAQALARGPFVLGNQFHFNRLQKSSPQCLLHPVTIALLQDAGEKGGGTGLPESSGVFCNLPLLAEKVSASGFLNFSPDPDGMLRRLPLLIQYNGDVYPSLALAAVLKLNGTDNVVLKKNGQALQALAFHGVSVPVDARGQLLIKYRGAKNNYRYISAADIMDRRISAERLQGRIVFVGTSAAGLKETLTTPLAPVFPGIEVHATIADNLLSGDIISVPGWSTFLVLLLVLVLGIGMSLLAGCKNAAFCFMAMFLSIGGLWLATQQIFFHLGLYVGPAFPMGSVFCTTMLLTILHYRSERRQAERAVLESEARFRTLFTMAPMPMCHLSLDGKILHMNDRFKEMMGYGDAEMPTLEQVWSLALPEAELREQITSKWRSHLERARADQGELESFESPMLAKDGASHAMVINTKLIADSIIVSFFDVSEHREAEKERQRLQQRLYQSQKMEAIGILAGGIAHDFNNMLGAIIGYAELAMREMGLADPLRKNFERILDAAQRSANLTRQLLAFARKQPIKPIMFELNEAVEAMLKMIRQLIRENIELIWRPGPSPCTVRMDPSQLDQILVNLCVNARDAIAGVGRVTIETDTISCGHEYKAAHPEFIPGVYVLLVISDNGPGMDKKTLDHIFEPFFTTKAVGKGTGLGLATVYGIVKQNEGFIYADSKPGKGSVFKVYLPLHHDEATATRPEHAEDIRPSRDETVLIVEDDPALLEMSKMMLQKIGYSVLAAGTPKDAIRIAEENSSEIQLLIADMVMPEMNGRTLAEKLLAIRPKMKLLFMSGYTADIIAHQCVMDKEVNFLQKPFSLKELAAKVREVLG